MKSFALCLLLSLYCPLAARAQSLLDASAETDRLRDPDALPPQPAAAGSGAYVSGMFGNGRAYGGNTSGDKNMKWRALELRFGKDLDTSVLGIPLTAGKEKIRVDFVHYNEGHPDNNHRDGFGAQLVYNNALTEDLTVEIGAGPHLTMNTTDIGGEQINDSNLGILLSLALRIELERYSPGLHMRIAVNRVAVPDVHSSTALLVGIGKYFSATPPYPTSGFSFTPVWIGVSASNAVTNQSDTEHTYGFAVEAKHYWGSWAASVAAIVEGDDDNRVDRSGIAAQAWFVQPLTEKWTVSAGFGPYFARNNRESPASTRTLALISLQAERSISKTTKVFASFSRVATFTDRDDRDLFRIGLAKQFGG
jgi:hypothetical protein